MPKVVTANTLATGHVVYLADDGTWVGSIAQAETFADDDAAESGLVRARRDEGQSLIVDPFVTEKGPEKDGRPTMTLRDTIRAFGPTIRYLPDVPGTGRG